jgi:uncharacterized protein YbjT (DUF2867 family)
VKKIFLVGATGYVGGVVAERLTGSDIEILGLARSEDKASQLLESGITPVRGDLKDLRSWLIMHI